MTVALTRVLVVDVHSYTAERSGQLVFFFFLVFSTLGPEELGYELDCVHMHVCVYMCV